MPFSLRVKLTPPATDRDGSPTAPIRDATLELERLGAPSTQLAPDSPTSAEIGLAARLLASAAPDAEAEERPIGRLGGTLSLDPSDASITFELAEFTPDPDLPPDPEPDPSASSIVLRRKLRLNFSDQFTSSGELDLEDLRVPFPGEPDEDFRHLELTAELSVGGSVEAAKDSGDVLDVPLVPRPFILLELVDEVGEPLANQTLGFEFEDTDVELTTDDDGRVRIDQPPDATANLSFSDLDGLKAELKSRWDSPRSGARIADRPGTKVALVEEIADDVPIEEGPSRLSIQPRVIRAHLVGAAFDTSKAFLLPSPSLIAGLRGMKSIYDDNPNSVLLIVGHCDTAGSRSYNDQLSLERAKAMKAYLTDDVDTWIDFYGKNVPAEKRWGSGEDTAMLGAQPDSATLFAQPDPLVAFQNARGLDPSGKVDDATRRELIKGYMSQDGTTLPDDVDVVTHGAGENFPEEPTPDGTPNAANRRVELFFFDKDFGVQPPPPGENSKPDSKEYPEWRRRAIATQEFLVTSRDRLLRVRLQLDGNAVANKDYQVFVDDLLLASGTTDDDGLVEEPVPSDGKSALIRVPDPGFERAFDLTPKKNFPRIESTRGAQARLRGLGFYFGDIDGIAGDVFDAAVQAFKRARGLPDDSVLDDPTRTELLTAYGS